MRLLRVDSSIRTEGSVSRALADTAQQAWQQEHPDGQVVLRDVGARPLAPETWIAAHTARFLPPEQHTPAQQQAVAVASELRDEVLDADAYLFAVPLYNWNVPLTIKIWIDLLFTLPELGPGGDEPVSGRPALLLISRGGAYGAGTSRDGWDHATPWLQRVFADVFKLDLRTVAAELTLAAVVPAMAELRGLAAESLNQAHADADRHGREIAPLSAGTTV